MSFLLFLAILLSLCGLGGGVQNFSRVSVPWRPFPSFLKTTCHTWLGR